MSDRGCWLKVGGFAYKRHCGKHGRTAGWPCGVGAAQIESETSDGAPRVLVTGSRHLTDPRPVFQALTAAWKDAGRPIRVVHGACPTGADEFAERWAQEHEPCGITVERWPADWRGFGRSAGPRRNSAMVNAGAWRVLAWPIGSSPGTRGCIRAAQAAGLHVIVHEIAAREAS